MREFIVEADGGSRGNPGPAGYGAVVCDAATGQTLAEAAEYLGVATNNVAEYRGLLAGLRSAHALDPTARVHVRMDSKLVVEQMSGRWKIKHPDMKPLATEARSVFPPDQVSYEWIPRERNKHADRLANEAMDAGAKGRQWSPSESRAALDTPPAAPAPSGPPGDAAAGAAKARAALAEGRTGGPVRPVAAAAEDDAEAEAVRETDTTAPAPTGEPRVASASGEPRLTGTSGEQRVANAPDEQRGTGTPGQQRLPSASGSGEQRVTNAPGEPRGTGTSGEPRLPIAPGEPRLPSTPGEQRVVSTPGWSSAPDLGAPATLVLLRHGETPLTPQKRFSGSGGSDPGLSAAGREQAHRVAEALARRGTIQAVVASPLARTRETAGIVAARLNLDVTIEDGLRETDFGAWEGLTFGEVRERHQDDLNAWLADPEAHPTGGGESFAETATRIAATRDKLVAAHAGRTVLLVTHVTPIKTLIRLALGAPPESLFRMELSAASLSAVAYYADGNASVRLFNDTSHLRP
ncbi:bifunctional RNase H/acid phosphatase [Streptomyces sp. NRRL S-1022]|uniref:bifunctional RNase H/acid phosphatase n=1 Tax=Streptomyces sp. NRRL S-1022 TaxID=1463880 RepID=UPI0004C01807|nr:bifunctional RNase H/acid phosphatase [Streptomyces sp. NRRL S-1022]